MIDHARAEWWRPDVAVDRGDRGEAPTAADSQISDSAIPFGAMMTFTFILLLAPQLYFPSLEPFHIALLTGGFAIAAHLFDTFIHRRPIPLSPEIRIAACLVAWAIVTVPLSYSPGGSVSLLLGVYLKSLAIFWLLSDIVTTLSRLHLVAWALTLMTVPLAATALDNFNAGTFIRNLDGSLPPGADPRIIGYNAPLTGNPNGLAEVLNLILPLSLALFSIARRTWVRAVLLAVIALDVIAVVVTFSRSGFLALATIFAMYLWKLRKRPEGGWAVVALVIALVCITPLFPSNYWDRVSTITNKDSDPTSSAQHRWRDMVAAANFVVKNPIVGAGVGMNSLALYEERGPYRDYYNQKWMEVHNVYLVYAVELGIPGLVLFLMLFAGCMKSTMSVQARSAGVPALRELFYLAEGIQISLIAYAVTALFDPSAYSFYFYYFAGLAVAVRAAYEAESSKPAMIRISPPSLFGNSYEHQGNDIGERRHRR